MVLLTGSCTLQMELTLVVSVEEGEGSRLAAGLIRISGRGPTVGSILSKSSVVVDSCLQNRLRSKSLLESTDLPCSFLRLAMEV